jgi:hypothetical protein
MSDQEEKSFEELVKEEFPEAEVTTKELAVIEGEYKEIQPFDIRAMKDMRKMMVAYVRQAMKEGLDYGTISGTGKPTLYKPGAEKLHTFFGFSVETKHEYAREDWDVSITPTSFPVFHYRYTTKIWSHDGTRLVATCDGEANSYESKYRWRWVPEANVPNRFKDYLELFEWREGSESEFVFAIDAAKTDGPYGKPQEYWDSWKKDIEEGNAKKIQRKTKKGEMYDAWERGGRTYRIPNEDIYSQINTLIKMAIKRSYVGAIIIAANASEFFTQDLEDLAEHMGSDKTSIKMLVPSKKAAANALMDYVESLGVENAGDWIKSVLTTNGLDFTLDRWTEIVELVDEIAIPE